MTDASLLLQQPVGDGGVASTNFFNGRLLTGSDFEREQSARAQADAQLGEAMGTGVAFGFDLKEGLVEGESDNRPIMIEPGLAVNSLGQTLRLTEGQSLSLTRPPAQFATMDDLSCKHFGNCANDGGGGTYVAGQGVYILTIAPASRRSGRTETNGLAGKNASCNIDENVNTVQFRLLEVKASLYGSLAATASDFRNRLAYRCFGDGVKADWVTDLMARTRRQDDLLAEMEQFGLGPHEVPLALLAYTGSNTLEYIDSWAVRRQLVMLDQGSQVDSLVQPRRLSTGMAMLKQFQDHFDTVVGPGGDVGSIRARTEFPYLPPAGILPGLSEAQAKSFFGGMTVRGVVHINGPQVEPLMRESLSAPALKTSDNEAIWLYAVAKNRIEGAIAASDETRPDPYLIYARGDIAYRGNARFNLHRWDYANYALD